MHYLEIMFGQGLDADGEFPVKPSDMDKATYEDAFKLAEGLKYSIINGKIAIDEGLFSVCFL